MPGPDPSSDPSSVPGIGLSPASGSGSTPDPAATPKPKPTPTQSYSDLPTNLKKCHATLRDARESRFEQALKTHADTQAQSAQDKAKTQQQQQQTLKNKKSQAFKSAQDEFIKHGPQGPFESFYAAVQLWTAIYYANKDLDTDFNDQQSQQAKSNVPTPKPTRDTSIAVELGEDDNGHLKMATANQDPAVKNTIGGFANDWAKQSGSDYRLHDDGFWHESETSDSPKVDLNTTDGRKFLDMLKDDDEGLQAKFNDSPGAKIKMEVNDSTYKTPGLTMMD